MATSYPLHKIKVVLFENIHPTAKATLEAAGFSVTLLDHSLSGEALFEAAGDAHLIGVRSKTHLRREFIERARRLWAIGCFCIGTNQVDLDVAAEQGVSVFNAPFSNTRSVAELVISEIVALHRNLFQRSAEMHAGVWRKSAVGVHEIRGKTLGIVGYGRIGSQVSILAEAMGMQVQYYDVVDVLPLGNARRVETLEALLGSSDVVSLHVPSTPHTKWMIGAAEIAAIKPGAYLLNNARGTVVEIEPLVAALKSGHLGGAAVDVYPKEPASNSEPFDSPLMGLDNVILTPHIGGSTVEAQEDIGRSVAGRLVKFMNNGSTQTAVNVPEVALPMQHAGHHRILHFHRNVPGVLGRVNTVVGELGANIAAEYLQSNGTHAYVILDVSPEHGEALKERLAAIPETIRVRTLW